MLHSACVMQWTWNIAAFPAPSNTASSYFPAQQERVPTYCKLLFFFTQVCNFFSASEPGTLIVLKCPYPWRVEEPSIYESVRVHTAIQTGRTENDLVPNAPSVWHLLHTPMSKWCQIIPLGCDVTNVMFNFLCKITACYDYMGIIFIVLAMILTVEDTFFSPQ